MGKKELAKVTDKGVGGKEQRRKINFQELSV